MDINSTSSAPTTDCEFLALPRIKTNGHNRHQKRQFEFSMTIALLTGVFTFTIAALIGLVSIADLGLYTLGMGTMFVLSIQACQNSRPKNSRSSGTNFA